MGELLKNGWVRTGLIGALLPVIGAGIWVLNGADTIASAFSWAEVLYRTIATPWGGLIFLGFCIGSVLYGIKQLSAAERDGKAIRREIEGEVFARFDKTIKFYGEFNALVLAERHIELGAKAMEELRVKIEYLESPGNKPWHNFKGNTEIGAKLREIGAELSAASKFLGRTPELADFQMKEPVLEQEQAAVGPGPTAGFPTYIFDPTANEPFIVVQRANLQRADEAVRLLRNLAAQRRDQVERADIHNWRTNYGHF